VLLSGARPMLLPAGGLVVPMPLGGPCLNLVRPQLTACYLETFASALLICVRSPRKQVPVETGTVTEGRLLLLFCWPCQPA